jgi:hypothetical protein
MRANRYSQIPQIMTGQLISPARPVFAVSGARGGVALELSSGSGSVGAVIAGSREVPSASTTLFSFAVKPKSCSNTPRHSIQFLV